MGSGRLDKKANTSLLFFKAFPFSVFLSFQDKEKGGGISLVAQCLRLHTPSAGGPGLIPGQGTRSHMHAVTNSSHTTTKEPAGHN